MRKKFMKLSVAVVAAAMAMSMAIPAMAHEVTLPSNPAGTTENHIYEVYQIFTGTYENNALSDVKWGENGKLADGTDATTGNAVEKAILDELAAVTGESESDRLDVIKKYADTAETPFTTGNAGTKLNLDDGYYLIKDSDDSTGVLTSYIVTVVGGNVEITAKSDKPTVDKEVNDETNEDTALSDTNETWSEAADHAINETFQFKLTAQLPANTTLDTYKSYYINFVDTLSTAVTFEKINSVTVKSGSASKTLDASDYVFVNNTNANGGGDFQIAINDLKQVLPNGVTSLNGVTVEVEYDAHLNESAAINNVDTNINKVHLEYSRNPEWEGTGKPDVEETPDDTVFVFTYDVPNSKVAEDGTTPLTTAGFTLYKGTKAAGNEVELIWDSSMNAFRPVKDGETGSTEMTTTNGGNFTVRGIDAGTYILSETTVPTGYTAAADQTIVITATTVEDAADPDHANATISKLINNQELGTGTNTVVNKKPSNLPEAGGMGTTILYTLGGLMVVGAGATLFAKKRISK